MSHAVFICRLLVLIACLFGGAGVQAAASPASIRVVLDDNYPPYVFRDANGQVQGILKELWGLWEKRTGIAVDFQAMDWAKAQAAIASGNADVIDTLFKTPERSKIFEFSTPYASIEVALFFHQSISGIADAESAKGFAIGVKDGDACIEYLSARGIADFRQFPSYESMVKAAAANDVRVLCIDKPPALYFFNRQAVANEFRHTSPLYVGQFHWAVPKGRIDLKEVVEAGFAKITPQERQAIETRWLGERFEEDAWRRYTRQIAYGVVALCVLIGVLFLWSWTLRGEVAERTADLKAALDSLRQAEERLRTLFEQASDAIFIMRGATVIDCNQRAELLYRVPRMQIIGTTPMMMSPALQRDGRASEAVLQDVVEQAMSGQPTVFEWLNQLSDGTQLDVEVNLSRVDFGNGICLQAIVRDVSERKHKDRLIEDLLKEQRIIFDNAHVGILELCNRRILKCNQRIADMFGFASPALLEGQSTEVFYCCQETYVAAGKEGYAQLAQSGYANFETEMCRQDGEHIWVIQSGRPVDPNAVLEAPSIWVYTDITERKRADIELRHSRLMFSTAFESCPIAASIATLADGRFIEANANYARDFGWTPADLIGRTSFEVGFWPDASTRQAWIVKMQSTGRLLDYETVWLHKNGEPRNVSLSSEIIEVDGQSCILAYVADITARKRAEADLRIAAAAFESQEAMMVTDARSVILRVNRAFTEITGYAAEEVIGKTPRLFKSDRHDDNFYRAMWDSITRTGSWQGEIWDRRKSGEIYPKWLMITAVYNELGEVANYVGTHFDITERKQAEEKIKELAFFDQLTTLPNRTLLLDRVNQTLAASQRSGIYGALLFIDLDNFKTLNDTLGHDYGDMLLQQAARRLLLAVREGDTVARLGGDEFVLLLPTLTHDEAETANVVEMIAEKVLATLNQPYTLGEFTHHVTGSIGVTLFKGDAASSDDLMKQADLAMYKSKAGGRNRIRFFDPALEKAVMERAMLEEDLRHALSAGEFLLHYQPQIVGRTQPVGAEVLVRWLHPRRGMVSPADFIPVAEESGLIVGIGQWVLETACRQLAAWADDPLLAALTVSVNVSARQFHQEKFADQVIAILEATGANPRQLKLELTESLLAENVQDIIDKMFDLKARGVGFSLDDFGTGYSSLSYLKQLPLDHLKIDQSFVRDVLEDPNDAAIARTIIALTQSLGLGVIAEGVETEAQLEFLADHGCHVYQGYFFSRPLPLAAFETFVRAA